MFGGGGIMVDGSASGGSRVAFGPAASSLAGRLGLGPAGGGVPAGADDTAAGEEDQEEDGRAAREGAKHEPRPCGEGSDPGGREDSEGGGRMQGNYRPART